MPTVYTQTSFHSKGLFLSRKRVYDHFKLESPYFISREALVRIFPLYQPINSEVRTKFAEVDQYVNNIFTSVMAGQVFEEMIGKDSFTHPVDEIIDFKGIYERSFKQEDSMDNLETNPTERDN